MFVGPALVIVAIFLVYPVINTIILSFRDARSEEFVGLENYRFLFTDESMLRSIRNTLGWVVLVPLAGVSVGLVFATLADRLRHGEGVAKSMIFLPMAISLVGAAVVWRFIYSFRPEGFGTNIGLLNAVGQGLGHDPVPWLQEQPWNNLLLIVIMVWIQTGFAMVVLSAAIKAIPVEIIEAARIDGASELQVFRRIIVPSILPTITVVVTYMVISSLKVFDIVFVMGNAETQGTEVMAERMVRVVLHPRPRRPGCGHRRRPVPGRDPGHGLEHPSLPRAGGHPMSVARFPSTIRPRPGTSGVSARGWVVHPDHHRRHRAVVDRPHGRRADQLVPT